MATQMWAEGAWIGKRHTEQKEAWSNQVFEVRTWRQVRGPAGAVICETRDFGEGRGEGGGGSGIKWPQWRTLIFEGQVRVDMRFACPKDVKKLLLKQARSTYRKKSASKHVYEELKEGIWLEPGRPTAAEEIKGRVDRKTSICCKEAGSGRRLGAEETFVDIGWSDESECQACHKEEGSEKHSPYHCPE